MLHLRAVCPQEKTASALGILRAHAGTAHLVVHRGAAVEPAGDLVEADIAREAADEIIDAQVCRAGILRAHAGTAHLVVHRGAAVEPAGDLVEADIAREAADEIIDALCALDLVHTGVGQRRVERFQGEAADAVVWEAGIDAKPAAAPQN
ncbi:hypothetical protein H480_12227 [Amycolatopsis vancoresmycina DSM 44592]|uniref:Uncharacterized protein n=1 Tax=Amycolatopsis vancoresmycina DSM 44592 TaxID=1292037 RepID=R1GA59_9PSEU|nr:hypothetical protein H480_12227 [Amycolatopsis vancoresmycina DSM 44592]